MRRYQAETLRTVGSSPRKDVLGWLVPKLWGRQLGEQSLGSSANGQGETGGNVKWMSENNEITTKSKSSQSCPCHFAEEDRMEGCFDLKLKIKIVGNKDE